MFDKNREIKLENERDLHYKVIEFINTYLKEMMISIGLGEYQQTDSMRIDCYRKGYRAGYPDIVILNANEDYNGICIELKSPTGKGVLSEKQSDFLEKMRKINYQIIISNDYDKIIFELMEYYNNGMLK